MEDKKLKKQYTPTQKITISGVVIALYLVIMYLTQNFAFGQYQIRIATSIYALTAIFPFLILPMGLSNMLSNILLGGFGLPDMLGGLAVGLLTAFAVYQIKKYKLNDWLISLPIILFPGLIVPIWLSVLLKVPYYLLATSVTIGQIIPGIVGVILVKQLRNRL
ncbi:QueT transporter family protein [Thermoanaerobacterium sp. RBIITD]|uniref:QueT transporter family protein n=1 Tax=Thermoanaerobacterium sp. RBIITD TaxID=1550240 RepID=UPI000BB74EFD|nr:QueT transporter family protein [Thermoanaerobacterium sp. RBIITD]SNX54630.1 QueT transporter [Thermoanaerobacterium sp. RBIITD]